MKPKSLIPFAVILVILAALVMFRQAQDQPVSITEQVDLTPLVPASVEQDDVARLELYSGGAPDEKLILAKAGDGWQIESQFNAPVSESKINTYLETLTGLEGEFRATVESSDGFETYQLTEETAFHVYGYGEDGEEALFHVMVGEAPKMGTVFMRAGGGQDVYVANKNPRQDAGVTSDARDATPNASTWLDKEILALNTDNVRRLAMTYPDKELVFEAEAQPVEQPEGAEAGAGGDSESPEGEGATAAPEPQVEYKWELVSGGLAATHKQSGLDSILKKLGSLRAQDVVDPSKKGQYGLENPAYRIVASVEGRDDDVVLEAGRTDTGSDGYVRLANAERDIVYRINRYGFEQLFPKGNALFDLPGLSLDAANLSRIELTMPEGPIVLEKPGEEWTVTTPAAPITPVDSALNTIASTLASWKAQDYADSAEGTGLNAPEYSATWTTAGGESYTLDVGNPSEHIEGPYVHFNDNAQALAMLQSNFDKVFKKPSDLFDRALFSFFEEDLTQITIDRAGEFITLHKSGGEWILSRGEESFGTNQEAVGNLAFELTGLEATDLRLTGADEAAASPVATLTLQLADGTSHKVSVGPLKDGTHAVIVDGKPGVAYLVPEDRINTILPETVSLMENEPAPMPSGEEPTGEDAGAQQESPEEGEADGETPVAPAEESPATP